MNCAQWGVELAGCYQRIGILLTRQGDVLLASAKAAYQITALDADGNIPDNDVFTGFAQSTINALGFDPSKEFDDDGDPLP